MGSPVSIAFHSFIKIDRRKEDPVYLQLVYQFINAVRMSLLEDGDQLPGSRKIAEDLQLHRKSVVAALQELQEQGWVTSQANVHVSSGTLDAVGDYEITTKTQKIELRQVTIDDAAATVYGCDLTDGYVRINADYTT